MVGVSQIPVILPPLPLSKVIPDDALSFLPCYSPYLTTLCVILLLLILSVLTRHFLGF